MYVPKSRLDLPKDAPPWAVEVMTQLRNEHKAISQAMASSTGTTLIISGASTAVSGGGSSIPVASANVKAGTQIVVAATDAWVPFPTTFSTAPTVTLCFVAGTDSSFGTINTQNLIVTNAGFHIPAADIMVSGNVFFIAVLNS